VTLVMSCLAVEKTIVQNTPSSSVNAGWTSKSIIGQIPDLIFCVDWDDTLCASTELHKFLATTHAKSVLTGESLTVDVDSMSVEVRNQWRHLAMWVKVLLHQMLMYAPGNVYIVTNSQAGWVELSVERFLPELKPLLPRLKIISARTEHSTSDQEQLVRQNKIQESDLVQWKYRAFVNILKQHLSSNNNQSDVGMAKRLLSALCKMHQPPNLLDYKQLDDPPLVNVPVIIAMGDSNVELRALDQVAQVYNLPLTKWVKFATHPTLDTLTEQVHYVSTILPSIIWHRQPLRITLNPNVFSSIDKKDPF